MEGPSRPQRRTTLVGVGSWIAVIAAVVVAVVVVVVIIVVVRRRRGASARGATPSTPRHAMVTAPMTDLESALARVTDRDGRPIREKIEAESVHVDPLRDPEDTGPLLRRALDSVAHHDDPAAPAAHDHRAAGDAPSSGGDARSAPPWSPPSA